MRTTHIVLLLGAVAVVRSPTVPSAPVSRPWCSKVLLFSSRYDRVTYFAATAMPDTLLAGEGVTKPLTVGGHSGNGRPRAVYGQLVGIDSIGGAHLDAVRAALADSQIVVVPWDYDASCETTYWSASARWVAPGLVGFYTALLRDRQYWAGDRPTFDVFSPDQNPYPHTSGFASNARWIPAGMEAWLDARGMFSLYQALPLWNDSSETALAPLAAWKAAHPDLAAKYPANDMLRSVLERPRR